MNRSERAIQRWIDDLDSRWIARLVKTEVKLAVRGRERTWAILRRREGGSAIRVSVLWDPFQLSNERAIAEELVRMAEVIEEATLASLSGGHEDVRCTA